MLANGGSWPNIALPVLRALQLNLYVYVWTSGTLAIPLHYYFGYNVVHGMGFVVL